jgi:putative inorganic carbon (hco3(-)) transporter
LNFIAFLILNAVIFIRPAEIFEAAGGVPFYSISMLICLVANIPQIIPQLTPKVLASRPISVCVLLLLPAIAVSGLWNGNVSETPQNLLNFGFIVAYYLLLIGSVDTIGRLRSLLMWIAIFIGVTAVLCLLNYHAIIDLPALKSYGEGTIDEEAGGPDSVLRLQATGLFNNPNALARILTVAILASLYAMTDSKRWWASPLWAAMIGILGYALHLTHSRGGLIGLIGGVAFLLGYRFGLKKTIPIAGAAIVGILALFGGRQADVSTDEGTGRQRILLWKEGFELLKPTPLVGIGVGRLPSEIGLCAHNSFVEAYVEIGFLGGSCFAGAYALAIAGLWKLRDARMPLDNPELTRVCPYVFAILGGEIIGQLSITRIQTLSTYLPLGMAAISFKLAAESSGVGVFHCSIKLLRRIAAASLVFLLILIGYVKIKTMG